MKGLRKYIAPFAPDQSGAVSVFFELGGIVVICDAGGCTGNICGFDDPRWFREKSAIFSAGLRDMDAILGRDDKLVEKLAMAAEDFDATFAAVVGTPVPAVIATDYQALCRMAEKKTGLKMVYTASTGTYLYDKGASEAYMSLLKRFMAEDARSKREEMIQDCVQSKCDGTEAEQVSGCTEAEQIIGCTEAEQVSGRTEAEQISGCTEIEQVSGCTEMEQVNEYTKTGLENGDLGVEKKNGCPENNLDTSCLGIWGYTPLDMGNVENVSEFFSEVEKVYLDETCEVADEAGPKTCHYEVYGTKETGLRGFEKAASVDKNLVVAPSGLAAARFLKERYHVPYEIGYPMLYQQFPQLSTWLQEVKELKNTGMSKNDSVFSDDKACINQNEKLVVEERMETNSQTSLRVLVVHQHILADALRKELYRVICDTADKSTSQILGDVNKDFDATSKKELQVDVATFFLKDQEVGTPQDRLLIEEDDWIELVKQGDYDVIFGDWQLQKAIPFFKGRYYNLSHYAVSGAAQNPKEW